MFRILNMKLLSERFAHIHRLRPDLEGDRGQTGLVRVSGASKSVVNQWLNDKIKSIDIRYALSIERELGISHIWLMTGDGEPLVPPAIAPSSSQSPNWGLFGASRSDLPATEFKRVVLVDDDSPDLYRIPRVLLRLQAGVTGFQTEPDRRDGGTMGLSRNWVDRKGLDPAKLISIDVKGESMEPTFYEGDTVVINLDDTKPTDNGVFAINYDGEAVIKRLSRDVGKWWLMSDNQDQRRYYRRACQGAECIIIGRIVRREGDHF